MLFPRQMKKFVTQRVKKGDIIHPMASDFFGIDLYLKKWPLLIQEMSGSKLRIKPAIKLPRNDNTILRENRFEEYFKRTYLSFRA